MAELLVLNKSNQRGDAGDAGRYCRGDVVCVQPDGHKWGSKEGLPDFVVVKLPGVPAEQLQDLMEPDESELLDKDGERTRLGRRKQRLDLAKLGKLADGKVTLKSAVALRGQLTRAKEARA